MLRDSTVTGNNGLKLGFDIEAGTRLRVVETSCGRSVHAGMKPSGFGVCSLD